MWENAEFELDYEAIMDMTEKRLKKALENIENEKKRCAEMYPDWRDDEYNCGACKFIWGVSYDPTDVEVSFYTNNELVIMYDRDQKLYYIDCDFLNGKTLPLSLEDKKHLNSLCRRMLDENNIDFPEFMPGSFFLTGLVYAESLKELIQKNAFIFTLLCS